MSTKGESLSGSYSFLLFSFLSPRQIGRHSTSKIVNSPRPCEPFQPRFELQNSTPSNRVDRGRTRWIGRRASLFVLRNTPRELRVGETFVRKDSTGFHLMLFVSFRSFCLPFPPSFSSFLCRFVSGVKIISTPRGGLPAIRNSRLDIGHARCSVDAGIFRGRIVLCFPVSNIFPTGRFNSQILYRRLPAAWNFVISRLVKFGDKIDRIFV